MKHMNRTTILTLPLLALAACSSGPDQDAELREAVEAYSAAFLAGEGGEAIGLMSSRCEKEMAGKEGQFLNAVATLAESVGPMPIKTYSAEIDGEAASVTYTYSMDALNQSGESWVLENGEWHNDECPTL